MMKGLLWKSCLIAACALAMGYGRTASVYAANEEPGGPDERLQRLERRLNELAERQELMMHRLGDSQEAQEQMMRRFGGNPPQGPQPMMPGPGPNPGPGPGPGPGQGRPEPMMPEFGPAPGPQGPMPAAGSENLRPGMPMMGPPGLGVARALKGMGNLLGLLFLVGIVCNILLAVWIYSDIRKRGEGSGIFVALALLAGIPTAIIYSLVRIGDKK